MDTYVEHRSKMAANGDGAWSVNSGGMNTSRLGFRGTEDLGGGLKALFQLESEVNVDSGRRRVAVRPFGAARPTWAWTAGSAAS